MVGVNQDVVINRLIQRGVIERSVRRGRYFIVDEDRAFTRDRNYILERFATHPTDIATGEILVDRYLLNHQAIAVALIGRIDHEAQQEPVARPHRTITRYSYHTGDRDYDTYIQRVPVDADGVRRTFGLEYEVYALNSDQESELAYLLDTLPAHVTERDGSLGCGGVEIVFMPMSAADYIATVNKLKQFVTANGISMEYNGCGDGAGMHTTYGVSNFEASKTDLQIRLNRYALAMASLASKQKIKEIFGRTFGNYRSLPENTMTMVHSNAFSCNGRPRSCWECRLPSWRADPAKLVEFFRITETVFHRPFNATDFAKLYEFLGANVVDGE